MSAFWGPCQHWDCARIEQKSVSLTGELEERTSAESLPVQRHSAQALRARETQLADAMARLVEQNDQTLRVQRDGKAHADYLQDQLQKCGRAR